MVEGREPAGDFLRMCAEEDRRVAEGWSPFWRYVHLGRYGEQLDHLFGLFPGEQVMMFRYLRLLDEPAQVLDEICAFLGVEQGVISEVPRENVRAHPRRSVDHAALSRALRGAEAATVVTRLERILQRDARPRQPLT